MRFTAGGGNRKPELSNIVDTFLSDCYKSIAETLPHKPAAKFRHASRVASFLLLQSTKFVLFWRGWCN